MTTPFHVAQLVSPYLATGSLAATETGDTVAAAGTLTLAGTLAAVETGDTVAVVANLGIGGTIAAVETGDSIAVYGGSNSGTIAVVETGDVVAAGEALDLEWIDRNGVRYPWPSGKLQGIQGVGAPPVQAMSVALAALDGERRTSSKWLSRQITVPFVLADTETNVRTQMRAWAPLFDPALGGGSLLVGAIGAGAPRRIYARYIGGLETTIEYESFISEMVTFQCDDPFFYDFNPSNGRVDGVPFTVGGDVGTWPIICGKHADDSNITTNTYRITNPFGVHTIALGGTATMVPKAFVVDHRPLSRGVWATPTVFADPLADYLQGGTSWTQTHDFYTLADISNPPYLEVPWIQIPYDQYGVDGVYNSAPGVATLTAAAVSFDPQIVWTCRYYKAWLTQ